MVNLTYTEYVEMIDNDFRHIEFLSKDIATTPIEKYICRLLYGIDPDVYEITEIINLVNVFIGDKKLVTKIVNKYMKHIKDGFIRIGGTTNLMTSNGLVVTWNYRLPEATLQYGTNTVMVKLTSKEPDYNVSFKTISEIREMHNEYLVQLNRFPIT